MLFGCILNSSLENEQPTGSHVPNRKLRIDTISLGTAMHAVFLNQTIFPSVVGVHFI
jgi:hypothetical protein